MLILILLFKPWFVIGLSLKFGQISRYVNLPQGLSSSSRTAIPLLTLRRIQTILGLSSRCHAQEKFRAVIFNINLFRMSSLHQPLRLLSSFFNLLHESTLHHLEIQDCSNFMKIRIPSFRIWMSSTKFGLSQKLVIGHLEQQQKL